MEEKAVMSVWNAVAMERRKVVIASVIMAGEAMTVSSEHVSPPTFAIFLRVLLTPYQLSEYVSVNQGSMVCFVSRQDLVPVALLEPLASSPQHLLTNCSAFTTLQHHLRPVQRHLWPKRMVLVAGKGLHTPVMTIFVLFGQHTACLME